MSLSTIEQLQEIEKHLKSPEQFLGKGLKQPFNNTNSSSRKILFSTQFEHSIPLYNAEVALISTGYENEFGRYSSSLKINDTTQEVYAKISKFEHDPNYHYWMIFKSGNEYDVLERISYCYTSETYGYPINNEYLDKLKVSDIIPPNTTVQKSISFDKYNNRMDGINLVSAYLSIEKTTEDAVILSESAAKKLEAPIYKKIRVIINNNDILLNLMGKNGDYKSFPNIGEHIQNKILLASRREKKEERLFTQSYYRLSDILISDDKFTVDGQVIDIDIFCNDPDLLRDSYYNQQLYSYYLNRMRYARDFVNAVEPLIDNGNKLSYDLEKMYMLNKDIADGKQFMNEKIFSNTIIDFMVLERKDAEIGDKLSDRYGGKGVIAGILPDHLMPRLDNGEIVEAIYNSSGVVNRLNPGQLFETSINFRGSRLLDYFNKNLLSPREELQMYLDFLSFLSMKQHDYISNFTSNMKDDQLAFFMESIKRDGHFNIAVEPISESVTIDTLNDIDNYFGSVFEPYQVMVAIKDSNGNIRYTNTRRTLICGKKYIYRMKQYAEEKFSVTSLSPTNLKNENTKSRSSKNYKALYPRTPINFGNMEMADLLHLNVDNVITMLMLYSASPMGRRISEELLTGDPFNVDVRLDNESKNRNVEILNAYLKTQGLRLVFERIRKIMVNPMKIYPMRIKPIKLIIPENPNIKNGIILDPDLIYPMIINPIKF